MKVFSSDLHFFHNNICKFTERKRFTTPDDHCQWLLDIHNSQVSDSDVFYHLGDFSFNYNEGRISEVLRQMKGEKIFILGNHDDESLFTKLKARGHVTWFGHYKEIKLADTKVVLFHFPIMSWHQQARGSLHLHGHCHSNMKDTKGKMLDVGIDSAFDILGEHKYFTEDFVLDYMKNIAVYVTDHHKEVK